MGPGIRNYIMTSINIPVYYYFIAVGVLICARILLKKLPISLLLAYIFLVLSQTVLSRNSMPESNAKWIPFRILFEDNATSWKGELSQIGANIIMFVPIGIFLFFVLRKCLLTALASAAYATVLELLQFFLHRGLCEIDDIISNTMGALIGFFICQCIKRLKEISKYNDCAKTSQQSKSN